jgi:hypothetical protein
MARYKRYDADQDKFIPVSFREQILPGTFEYALSEIVDQHIDLSVFASRYANDATGRLAYDPAVLSPTAYPSATLQGKPRSRRVRMTTFRSNRPQPNPRFDSDHLQRRFVPLLRASQA